MPKQISRSFVLKQLVLAKTKIVLKIEMNLYSQNRDESLFCQNKSLDFFCQNDLGFLMVCNALQHSTTRCSTQQHSTDESVYIPLYFPALFLFSSGANPQTIRRPVSARASLGTQTHTHTHTHTHTPPKTRVLQSALLETPLLQHAIQVSLV